MTSKTGTSRVVAAERRAQAMKLRAAGLSLTEIARRLDVSITTAHKYIKRSLADLNAESVTSADYWRRLQLERYETLLANVNAVIATGRESKNWESILKASGEAVKILSRIDKLLGLEAPQTVNVNWRELAAADGLNPDETLEQLVEQFTAVMAR